MILMLCIKTLAELKVIPYPSFFNSFMDFKDLVVKFYKLFIANFKLSRARFLNFKTCGLID